MNSIRAVLALATQHYWHTHQLNVKSAILNGTLARGSLYVLKNDIFEGSHSYFLCGCDEDLDFVLCIFM